MLESGKSLLALLCYFLLVFLGLRDVDGGTLLNVMNIVFPLELPFNLLPFHGVNTSSNNLVTPIHIRI